MVTFHTVVSIAVPVTAVLGLIWLLGRRKPKKIIYQKPDSKSELPVELSQNESEMVKESHRPGSSDVSSELDPHQASSLALDAGGNNNLQEVECERHLVSEGDGMVVNGHIENVHNHKREQRHEEPVHPSSSQEPCGHPSSSPKDTEPGTASLNSHSMNAPSSSLNGERVVLKDALQEPSVNSHSPMNASAQHAVADVAKSTQPDDDEEEEEEEEVVEIIEEVVVDLSAVLEASAPPVLETESQAHLDGATCVNSTSIATTALDDKCEHVSLPPVHIEHTVEGSQPSAVSVVKPSEEDGQVSPLMKVQESVDEKEEVTPMSFKQNLTENLEAQKTPVQAARVASPPEPLSLDAGIGSGGEEEEDEQGSFGVGEVSASTPVINRESTDLENQIASHLRSSDLHSCDDDVSSAAVASEVSISQSSSKEEATACDSGLASISNHTLASLSSSSSDHRQYSRLDSETDEMQDSSSTLNSESVLVNGQAEEEGEQMSSAVRKEEAAGDEQASEEQLEPLTVSTSELGTPGDPAQSMTNAESPSIDSNSVGSNDSGRGGSVAESAPIIPMAHYEFYFPTSLCGRLIGKQGRNIKFIKEKSGANLTLKDNSYRADVQICIVEGSAQEVQKALELVRRKFPKGQYPDVDMSAINMPQGMPVLIPRTLQVTLPACVNTEVLVSSIIDAGHLYVTIPGNPTYPSLEELERFMTSVYSHDRSIPWLPRPVDPNVICAAPYNDRWYRVQVVRVIDDNECEIMYLDHGFYEVVHINSLRQIRQDYMSVPFQAIECYMGNISPLNGEECFSQAATDLLVEMTNGQLMQAQIVGTAEDGCPYIHLRAPVHENGIDKVKFINLELVSHNVVQWVEILPNV